MNGQQIIDMFELYLDDTSELSSSEELALLNRKYQKIARALPWEGLKTTKSGTLSGSVPYVTLPTDFLYMTENNQDADPGVDDEGQFSKVVFVGSSLTPVRIINFSDRRRYQGQNVAYVDLVNNRLTFIVQPSAVSYEFDYIRKPDDLTVSTSPFFPIAHEILAYEMAVDGYIIQLFDKARSYAAENRQLSEECMSDLKYYNANLRDNAN